MAKKKQVSGPIFTSLAKIWAPKIFFVDFISAPGATKTFFPSDANVLKPILWRMPSVLDNLIRSTYL